MMFKLHLFLTCILGLAFISCDNSTAPSEPIVVHDTLIVHDTLTDTICIIPTSPGAPNFSFCEIVTLQYGTGWYENRVELRWLGNTSALGYKIYRSMSDSLHFEQINIPYSKYFPTNDTLMYANDLPDSTYMIYWYRISAFDASGIEKQSNSKPVYWTEQ